VDGPELKGLPQPPDKPKRHGPKLPRSRGRSAVGKLSKRSGFRAFGRRKGSGLLKFIVKLIKKAARTKRSSDFRNRGYTGSGKGGRTGFSGMR
jgi:hypothetical protein